jgi:hypothetical protein
MNTRLKAKACIADMIVTAIKEAVNDDSSEGYESHGTEDGIATVRVTVYTNMVETTFILAGGKVSYDELLSAIESRVAAGEKP